MQAETHLLRRRVASAGLACDITSAWKVPLVNLYGPTETTIQVTSRSLHDIDLRNSAVPIGRPIWNTRVYVLDDGLQPVPAGVAGELYIAGAGLARGYLGRRGADGGALRGRSVRRRPGAACTAPATWRAGAPTGVLEFLGPRRRAGEDARLPHRAGRDRGGAGAPSPACAQAAVIAREDRRATSGWWPTWWRPTGSDVDATALRAHLAREPAGLHGAVGLRGAGRLAADAQRQARPQGAAGAGADAPRALQRAPRTPQEEILCALFAEVLGLERVGIDDNFFALGGDSIMSIQLVSRARQAGLRHHPARGLPASDRCGAGGAAEPAAGSACCACPTSPPAACR